MTEIIGRNLEVGVSVENVRGTSPAAAEKWAKNITANITPKAEHVSDESSHNDLAASDGRRVTKKWQEGDIEMNMHADVIGYFLYNIYGAIVSSLVSGSVYSHVLTLAQNIIHPALSMYLKDGDVDQNVINTVMVNTLTLDVSMDGYIKTTINVVGKGSAANSDTPSYDTEYDFIGRDVNVKIAATEGALPAAEAIKVKEMSMTFDTGIIRDHVVGQYEPDDNYNAMLKITGSMTLNFADTVLRDLFLDDTAKYMEIAIEGAADIGGANNPSLTILLNKVMILGWDRSGANDELVIEDIEFEAFYNKTDDQQSELTLQNLTAEYDDAPSA